MNDVTLLYSKLSCSHSSFFLVILYWSICKHISFFSSLHVLTNHSKPIAFATKSLCLLSFTTCNHSTLQYPFKPFKWSGLLYTCCSRILHNSPLSRIALYHVHSLGACFKTTLYSFFAIYVNFMLFKLIYLCLALLSLSLSSVESNYTLP